MAGRIARPSTPASGYNATALPDSRRAIRVFFVVLAGLLLLQAGLNVILNPLGAFPGSGNPIQIVRSSDSYQKLAALDRFLERTRGSDIRLALGSSRMILISGAPAGEAAPPFFNLAISGGQAEDILAFTRYVLERPDVRVVEVYINVDPQVLDTSTEYGRRLRGVYPLEREVVPLLTRARHALPALLGNDWIDSVKERLISGPPPQPARFAPDSGVRQEDVVFAPQVERAGGRGELHRHHVEQVLEMVAGTTLSERRVDDLREAVELWAEHGARVVLVFMPHSPLLWKALKEDSAYVEVISTVRQLMTDLSGVPDVVSCDFADPASVGLEGLDLWWDGVHYTSDGATIIFTAMQRCAAERSASSRVDVHALQ